MLEKIKKLVFHITNNARATTKELGKLTRMSQQAVSYQIQKFDNEKALQYVTIVDTIKLGFTHVLVGINLHNYNAESKRTILQALKELNTTASIQEGSVGVDFLIEVSARNLSHFNKAYSEFGQKYAKLFDTAFVYPIIVRHLYSRNYLARRAATKDIILQGDRELEQISPGEETVLKELALNPKITLTELAKKTKFGIKRVLTIKRRLEKREIIRGYSCYPDQKKFPIDRNVVLLRMKGEGLQQMRKFTEYTQTQPNIVELIKLIGFYDVLIAIESLQHQVVLEEIRDQFAIEKYQVINIERIHKLSYFVSE